MRRALVAGTALPVALTLSLGLSGCNGDDQAAKAGAASATDSASPTESPTGVPTGVPTDLPTDVPSDLPSDVPTTGGPQPSGAALDGCSAVTPELVTEHFGADPGQALSQPSSFNDPSATDCYFVGGEATIVVQATTRADQDMPESAYSYDGLPGAEEVDGADRGWAYLLPGQSGSAVTSSVILVKGQNGLDVTVSVDSHPYTLDTLQEFAADVLANL